MAERQKRAFVTGAAGFLGRNLIEALVRENWEIWGLCRKNTDGDELQKLNIHLVQGDITQPAKFHDLIPEGLDAIFHLASLVTYWRAAEDQQAQINVIGTRNIVSLALQKKVRRFIHTSTILTYDIFGPQPMTEETPLTGDRSRVSYVRTKRLGEMEVEKAIPLGLDAVILHPSVIIGAHDRHTWSKMFQAIERGTKLVGVPNGSVSWSHAQALADAHIFAYVKGRCGEHYLLGGPDATFLEFSQKISHRLGRPPYRKAQPAWLVKTISLLMELLSCFTKKEPLLPSGLASLMTRSVLCRSDKAIKELGYRPSSLEAMIEDCYQWMVAGGMLNTSDRR